MSAHHKRTRAAILPLTGDPFNFNYWMQFFDHVWGSEVDTLYVCLNGEVPDEVREFCQERAKKSPHQVVLTQIAHRIDHGPAIDLMLDFCREELVMLIEEDAIIFKKGMVDSCFREIEDNAYDIVGSARGSSAFEIIDACKRVFGTDDQGGAFWPNFFFCKKIDLLTTDRQFQAKSWTKGDYLDAIDHTIQDEIAHGDTFVWASLQLRGMGLRVKLVDQYHGSPEDLVHQQKKYNIFDSICPWFHIGSLSSWHQLLLGKTVPPSGGTIASEWERRVQFWKTFVEFYLQNHRENNPLSEFCAQYQAGIKRLIDEYNLSLATINDRQKAYQEVFERAEVRL